MSGPVNDDPTGPGTDSVASLRALAELPSDTLVSKADMARVFEVTARTIQRWVQAGHLPPPVQLGRRKMWLAGRLIAHIQREAAQLEAEEHRRRHRRRPRS